jgi:FtsP/CotA-like multicopper oxidase with cupredoxin domain
MNRRSFLVRTASGVAATYLAAARTRAQETPKADFTLRIGPVDLEIAPRRTIKTVGYNGVVPGPVLRLTEGQPVTIDVFNDSKRPELVHWHGLFSPSEVDGSAEEGTPMVAPKGHQRYAFTPRPPGTRWYHSHTSAGRDLHQATYSGQYGPLIVNPRQDPARYDQESVLALHGWEPYFTTMGDGALEVGYNAHTVNSHSLGSGEPVRVKEGERVLFRVLNASATWPHRLALAGHRMTVIALDGNAVPSPQAVDAVDLAPAERADLLVEMKNPGVWIFGDVDDKTRRNGLGIVVCRPLRRTGVDRAAGYSVGLHDIRQSSSARRTGRARPANLQAEMDGQPLGGPLDH